jgi:hypothetical protein
MTDHTPTQATDRDRLREIAELRKPMEKFSAMQEIFDHHPKVQEALANADRYGMSKQAALHQALDQHPDLKRQIVRMHEYFEQHVQPAMEKQLVLAREMNDPQLRRDTEGSLFAKLKGMHEAAQHWPDKDTVMGQNAGVAAQRKPGLGDILARFLDRLYEKLFGKPADPAADARNSAKTDPQKPTSGVADVVKAGAEVAVAASDPVGYAVTKGAEYVAKQMTTPNRPKGPR